MMDRLELVTVLLLQWNVVADDQLSVLRECVEIRAGELCRIGFQSSGSFSPCAAGKA